MEQNMPEIKVYLDFDAVPDGFVEGEMCVKTPEKETWGWFEYDIVEDEIQFRTLLGEIPKGIQEHMDACIDSIQQAIAENAEKLEYTEYCDELVF